MYSSSGTHRTLPLSLTRTLTPTSTHAGIVDCAACLVRLVRQLFPNAIDILDTAERGHFPGPPPALLPDTDAQSIVEVMLSADEVGLTEMGANQAVLVRCEAAKARLPFELRNGLVLTVEQSKGLEFDDVCLFDFFSDSPADKEWHVLYSMLPATAATAAAAAGRAASPVEDAGAAGAAGAAPPPGSSGGVSGGGASARRAEFDELRDLMLCEELKSLYVALTRSRKRCFVFDHSEVRRATSRAPAVPCCTARALPCRQIACASLLLHPRASQTQ